MSIQDLESEAESFRTDFSRITGAVSQVIVGQGRVVEASLTAILCGGNVLLEGLPGLGKTELVKTLSKVLQLGFNRIQFTPDLMPSDIVGTNVMNPTSDGRYEFEFRKGPIFTQLLLADEINRATPKTQAALLETMQEGSVTAAGHTYILDPPFFVLATQNPIEQEGTYPLPEAQLDRFLFKVNVPFPDRAELNEVIVRTTIRDPTAITPILDGARILELRQILRKVEVASPIQDYAVRLVLATHPDSDFAPEEVRRFVRYGASPRACQGLINAARVRALTRGRAHVSCSDVRHFANEVLQHRTLMNYDGMAAAIPITKIIQAAVDATPEIASS